MAGFNIESFNDDFLNASDAFTGVAAMLMSRSMFVGVTLPSSKIGISLLLSL